MFFLSILAFLLVLIETSGRSYFASYASLGYCLVVAVWTTLFQEAWKRKNATLAHTWDVTDFEEEEDPRPEYLANFARGRWRYRPEENLIGGFLDCLFLRGKMVEKNGFFTADRRFIESTNPGAEKHKIFPEWYRLNVFLYTIPTVSFFILVMLSGAFSILVLKMLVGVAEMGIIAPSVDPYIPMVLSTLWITVMNMAYQGIAQGFNDLENYRTETDYNDALIVKTIIFQFVNSYILLFYTAFVRSWEWPVGLLFGNAGRDPSGEPYRDMCGERPTFAKYQLDPDFWGASQTSINCNYTSGDDCSFQFVQRDCMVDLRLLMISFTVLKPFYELPLQIAGQIVSKLMGQARYLKQVAETGAKASLNVTKGMAGSARMSEVKIEMKDGGESSTDGGNKTSEGEMRSDFHNEIAMQVAQKPYGGTFAEYNPKVIQFGFIAMFSSAFPLAAVCAAVGNFLELRIDSLKLVTLSRRPRYQGAEDIGSWQGVLNTFSWIALPVNVFILVFTSWDFRNLVVIPAVLGTSGSATCYNATDASYVTALGHTVNLPAEMTISHHAAFEGRTTSFLAPCEENIVDCYAMIGRESWLPAASYASWSTVSTNYVREGLCRESSPLYNQFHCETCEHWTNQVMSMQWMIALVVEHCLILLKMLLGYIIPDKPKWVVDAVARKDFKNEQRAAAKERIRRSTIEGGHAIDRSEAEKEAEITGLVKEINKSDDQADQTRNGPAISRQNTQQFSNSV